MALELVRKLIGNSFQYVVEEEASGGTQPTTHESFGGGTSVTIPDGEVGQVRWVRDAGDVLVDLTDPFFPVVIDAGVYAVSAVFDATGPMAVGGLYSAELAFDYDGPYNSIAANSPIATAERPNPRVPVTLTYYIAAGAKLAATVQNLDGEAQRTFKQISAYMQRIA